MCWNIYNFYGIEFIIIDLNVYCCIIGSYNKAMMIYKFKF